MLSVVMLIVMKPLIGCKDIRQSVSIYKFCCFDVIESFISLFVSIHLILSLEMVGEEKVCFLDENLIAISMLRSGPDFIELFTSVIY